MGKKKNYHECLTTPFETGIRNFTEVARYFMYYAPEIDSAQSAGVFSPETEEEILTDMLNRAGLKKKSVFMQRIQVDERVEYNVKLSRNDWDSYETSWDFKRNQQV